MSIFSFQQRISLTTARKFLLAYRVPITVLAVFVVAFQILTALTSQETTKIRSQNSAAPEQVSPVPQDWIALSLPLENGAPDIGQTNSSVAVWALHDDYVELVAPRAILISQSDGWVTVAVAPGDEFEVIQARAVRLTVLPSP